MNIAAEHITVCSRDRSMRKLLSDVSCHFPQGTVTLLVGPTGAGKTTLLQVLAGLLAPHEGTVRYGGVRLWEDGKLRTEFILRINLVLQLPEQQLFAQSVRHEFDYSLRPCRLTKTEREERIREALQVFGLPEAILEQSPLALSGGQKRKIALAAALSTRPEWLLLDEPTAGLDADGFRSLLAFLSAWKARTSGGMVIATHDPEPFLPFADQVLCISGGKIAAAFSPAELYARPELLCAAGIGLPERLRLGAYMRQAGTDLPPELLQPRQMAELLLGSHLPRRDEILGVCEERAAVNTAAGEDREKTAPSLTFVESLDPRAKWLCYICLSLGIMTQHDWLGIFWSFLVTGAVIVCSRVPVGTVFKMTRFFIWFIFLSMLVAGLQISPLPAENGNRIDFHWAPSLETAQLLTRFLLVMALGIVLALTTSQAKMKHVLEQLISPLARWKFPVEAVSLGTSLMMKFIPLLLREAERFRLIAAARGKKPAGERRIRLSDVRAMTIPLLSSVLRLADDLALAMEVRGYRGSGHRRASAPELRLSARDYAVIALGLIVLALFVLRGQSS
jgi:energy-coupling factor transport system ATP-binding protein